MSMEIDGRQGYFVPIVLIFDRIIAKSQLQIFTCSNKANKIQISVPASFHYSAMLHHDNSQHLNSMPSSVCVFRAFQAHILDRFV